MIREPRSRQPWPVVAFALAASVPCFAEAQVSEPCCADFADGTTQTFAPCKNAPNIAVDIANPGPTGERQDFYLELTDQANASAACGTACTGDWTDIASAGCALFCFDIRIFDDGCLPGIPACNANGGWIPITPGFSIHSGPLRAGFSASFTITDDDGPNTGWHTVCAPIERLSADGQLPADDRGAWTLPAGTANSQWDALISAVQEIRLRVDFTSNPAEVVGYDNFCLRRGSCACGEMVESEVQCGPEPGSHEVTATLSNSLPEDVCDVLLSPPPGSGITIDPNVIPVQLAAGTTQSISFSLQGAGPGSSAPTATFLGCDGGQCCRFPFELELPECECVEIVDATAACRDTSFEFDYTFTLRNLEPTPLQEVFLVGSPGTTLAPSHLDLTPSVAPFATSSPQTVTVIHQSAEPACFQVAGHGDSCCTRGVCVPAPPLCCPDCL